MFGIYLTIKYNKKVPPEAYVDGAYVEQNVMSINLSNDDAIHASVDPATQRKEDNPDTGTKNILIFIVILLISGIIMIIAIKKNNAIILPILLLLIPLTIHALEKITIEVDAKIEIENIYRTGSLHYCHSTNEQTIDFMYEDGMTWDDFIKSDYYNQFDEHIQGIIEYTDEENQLIFSLDFGTTEYVTCSDEHGNNCWDYVTDVETKNEIVKPKSEGRYLAIACK